MVVVANVLLVAPVCQDAMVDKGTLAPTTGDEIVVTRQVRRTHTVERELVVFISNFYAKYAILAATGKCRRLRFVSSAT